MSKLNFSSNSLQKIFVFSITKKNKKSRPHLKQTEIGLVLIGSITVKGAFRRILLHAKFQLTAA